MRAILFSNGGWLLRVVTILALWAVITLSLLPRVLSHISTSATVNAPVTVIRSPLEGVIEEYTLATGAHVSPGQDLVVFREADTDRRYQSDLEARLTIAGSRIAAVKARIAEIDALRTDLSRRQTLYVTWHTAVLETEIEELDAQLRGANVRLDALKRAFDQQTRLRARGMASGNDLDDAAAEVEEQVERIRELQAKRDGGQLKLHALNDGVLAGTDGTNTPYTRQRQDEIGLELARLRDDLADHQAERRAITHLLAKERETYRNRNRVTLSSPVAGVVWRSAARTGRPVLPGDEVLEILDCRARFLEAYLPEGLMGTIALGDLAEVRLVGDRHVFRAPVISILGNGARFDHADLAARDTAPKTGTMRVLIQLDGEHVGYDASTFCHVGRTAQVSFPRDLTHIAGFFTSVGATAEIVVDWLATAASRVRHG